MTTTTSTRSARAVARMRRHLEQPLRTGRHRHRWRAAWQRTERGSVAAEVSLTAPFLIILLAFVAVVVHRGVDARLQLDGAAHQAARAASMQRTPADAAAAARSAATSALSSARPSCVSLTVDTATSGLRPGGTVTVTLVCVVDFGDALILGVPSTSLSTTAIEPVDRWRSTAAPRSEGDS